MSWWNDIQSVGRVNSFAQTATAVLTVLAAITGVLIVVTSNRLETLKAEASTPRVERLRTHEQAVASRITHVPSTRVRIETALGDLEALALAQELHRVLRDAGCQADRIDQSTHGPEFLDGIVVLYQPASAPAAVLARAPQQARIRAVRRRDPTTSGVIIRIGTESVYAGRRRTTRCS